MIEQGPTAKCNVDLEPGDTLELTYHPSLLERLRGKRNQTFIRQAIAEPLHITKVGVFQFFDEFGCKRGIGGWFGEE